MKAHSFTLLIFVTFIFLQSLSSTRAAKCHPDDKAGLLGFKSGITQDPSGILSSWKNDTACCTWDGVICDDNNDRVITLDVMGESSLGHTTLYGTISPLLVKLQHLESIYFRFHRKLTGPFPQFLFDLPKLRSVVIMRNRLSGPLPVNIGSLSQLQSLDLDGNRFTGQIPVSIGSLSQLQSLDLQGNRFTGKIPVSISNLTRLSGLRLGGNSFSGIIPNVFKSMTSLQSLDLSRNRFSGKFPPSLPSSTLSYLVLSQNNLSGTIPDYLSRFTVLDTLDLSKNRFTGTVPRGFVNLIKISTLDLSHNLLTGSFPDLNNITDGIRHLDLSYNQFQLNTIPEWATSSKIVTMLKLVKCGIKMSLDDWKPSEMYYQSIDLSENEISGSPTWFFNQDATDYTLIEFRASGNKLRFDMGKLKLPTSLESLDLSRNLVFGKVPKTVAGLKTLNLSQNHLCGMLPRTKFPASAFAGNDCLCGSPLAPCKA